TALTLYDVRGPPQLRAGPLVPQAGPRTINRNPAAAVREPGGEATSDDRAARGPFFPVLVCLLGAGLLYLAETLHMQPQNACQLPTSHIPTRYAYTTPTHPCETEGGKRHQGNCNSNAYRHYGYIFWSGSMKVSTTLIVRLSLEYSMIHRDSRRYQRIRILGRQ
ncbi:hypothetical protein CPAR01_16651, partial [Colletotrichum paranaense]